MRGISWLVKDQLAYQARTLFHGVSELGCKTLDMYVTPYICPHVFQNLLLRVTHVVKQFFMQNIFLCSFCWRPLACECQFQPQTRQKFKFGLWIHLPWTFFVHLSSSMEVRASSEKKTAIVSFQTFSHSLCSIHLNKATVILYTNYNLRQWNPRR